MPPAIISRRLFAGLLGKRRMLWRFLGGRLRSALLGSRLGEHGLELVDVKVGAAGCKSGSLPKRSHSMGDAAVPTSRQSCSSETVALLALGPTSA